MKKKVKKKNYQSYHQRKMNNTSFLPLDKFNLNPNGHNEVDTILDPQTFNLHTIVGDQVIDTQPLFNKEDDGTIVDISIRSLDNSIPEPTSNNSLNINNQPFFRPSKPFVCTLGDLEQFLHMNIPGYLYKVAIIKEKQQEIVKEEKESLIPLVLHLLHEQFDKPGDQVARQHYISVVSAYFVPI
ncbi:uncharacterized protein BX664DRAFT_320472, partial [Halteromyces radiatus]|uniref:uncharacterized protein n=1 Tax=Halteromyces radiatus TaxID=101107 RepID=UPI0022207153